MASIVRLIKRSCSICGADSDGVHFGAESCPACAAFFRRSVVLGKQYSCRREGACSTDKSLRCVCRACRFEKCVKNGMKPMLVQSAREGDNLARTTQRQLSEELDVAEKTELPISTLTSSSKAAQESQSINKMIAAYRQLLHNRIVTYCSNSLETMLISDEPLKKPELHPAKMANRAHFHRVEAAFAMEYVKSMDPFLQLPPDQKFEFFKGFLCIWGGIEGSYRTVKGGGFEKRWLIMPDNSYVELDNLQGYYKGETLKVDNETPARLFKPAGEQAVEQIMRPMMQSQMDDVEFVTLTAIASWACDPSLSTCSEETKALGKAARDQLCADLYTYYANTGVPDPDVRFGGLLLMVPALLEFARGSLENFRLAKFFDVMNYDKLLDDLFG